MTALRVLPALLLGFVFASCDSSKPITTPFDPSTIDYDAVTSLDYDDNVRPLLAARNVFGPAGAGAASPSDYDHEDVFGSEWGTTIVPFDATSPMLRLATESLADGISNPYPNLSRLEADEARYLTRWIEAGAPDSDGTPAYADASKYGTKLDQFKPLEKLLDQYHDVTWIGAHMGGNPEDLDWLHEFLQRHPNYVVDCSATKWQVRELSKHPGKLSQFIEANPGRVLFGSDIVAWPSNADPDPENPDADHGYDLYASRYWSLRTLLETEYAGPSPIVDPDLHMVDPSVDPKSTAKLCGAGLSSEQLTDVYHDAATAVLERGGVI